MVFISSGIWKGCKWVRRSKFLSGLNLNMVSWDPMQKQENFLSEGHRSKKDRIFWVQNIKVPFGIGYPHLHIKSSLYVCRRVQGSQIFKQNWIILICSRVIAILPIWVSLALGVGQVDGGYLGWPTIVYMSSVVFRGQESSNRIEISWLVQDLLNFGVLGSLLLWVGGDRWVGGCLGAWGCPHICAHTCACMHMHTHTCIHV